MFKQLIKRSNWSYPNSISQRSFVTTFWWKKQHFLNKTNHFLEVFISLLYDFQSKYLKNKQNTKLKTTSHNSSPFVPEYKKSDFGTQ